MRGVDQCATPLAGACWACVPCAVRACQQARLQTLVSSIETWNLACNGCASDGLTGACLLPVM
jgi:hypothetical protein